MILESLAASTLKVSVWILFLSVAVFTSDKFDPVMTSWLFIKETDEIEAFNFWILAVLKSVIFKLVPSGLQDEIKIVSGNKSTN